MTVDPQNQTTSDTSDEAEREGSASGDATEQEPEKPTDVAEKPGTDHVSHEHEDELVDEWGKESFPGSDPPAHY
ncbi:hypothetical protein [Leucobacter ruminantium]|uniref:Uncharacterized protein n=1 Tax=Leucobacter ruminantium TaxID=1289170 RepID=A0A939RZK4_9MICO|nr:hypothetical protein [Leucobacter ruminantium]MBO1805584.1 hypothetical protein [Leucobacter ruminantium]